MANKCDKMLSNTCDSRSKLKVDLKLKLVCDYVMFGGYKCKSKSVRFDSSGVNIDCLVNIFDNDEHENEDSDDDNDSAEESERLNSVWDDVLSVRVFYKEMVDFRYCDDEQTLIIALKPDIEWIHKMQSKYMFPTRLKYGFKFGNGCADESENNIIIEIEKSIINSDSGDNHLPNVSQLMDTFFSFLKSHTNLIVCTELEAQEIKKLLVNHKMLSRVRELTEEVQSLRQRLNRNYEIVNRTKSDLTFRFNIENFSKLNTKISSARAFVRNMWWSLMAMPITTEENGRQSKTLGLFLRRNSSGYFICKVGAELRLVSQKVGRSCFSRHFQTIDSAEGDYSGFKDFYNWNDILNAENGYINGDTVIVEVWLLVETYSI